MAIRKTGQISLAEALLGPRAAGSNAQLRRLSDLVKWYRFEKLLGHLRDEGPGGAGYPVLVLLKALLLQSLYGLSDRETEGAIDDRLSFRRFVGLGLDERVPDHTVLNRFRNLLVAQGLLEKLFAELGRQLEHAGLILKHGTMLDATLIPAAVPEPRKGAVPQDPDARVTARKGKRGISYGYKAHVGVDQGSGLIRRVITTPANVNDTVPADALICGDEAAVLGDAAYHTHAREKALKALGIKPRLARRPNKYHPELPPRLKRYNRLIARQRASVETTFATWKRRMGLSAVRYIGLAKVTAQVTLTAIAFNLRRWARLHPA
jgi:IS5 family transposase